MTLADLICQSIAQDKCGGSKWYALQRIAREQFAQKPAKKLKAADYISFARKRHDGGAAPSTIMGDMVQIRQPLEMATVDLGMDDVSLIEFDRAMSRLEKLGLVATSRARRRRVSDDEIGQITEYFGSRKSDIPMPLIIEYQVASTRRIGETTRVTVGGFDAAKHTILVPDVKHPTHKEGNHKRAFLPERAYEIHCQFKPRTSSPEERFFPYISKSITDKFSRAVDALKIDDLHLHDLRGEGISRLLESGYSIEDVMMVSLHDSADTLRKHYAAPRPEILLNGPASMRARS